MMFLLLQAPGWLSLHHAMVYLWPQKAKGWKKRCNDFKQFAGFCASHNRSSNTAQ